MKKTILTATLLLLMVSCSKEDYNPLLGSWKCLGFGEITNTGQVLFREPKEDCEDCYVIYFDDEYQCPAMIVANQVASYYSLNKGLVSIDIKMVTKIWVVPSEDDSFLDALGDVNQSKFEIKNDSLKLYYSTNKYLLFKLKNKLK